MTRYIGIDPSSKTGLVVLDEAGDVILVREITADEKRDPQRMIELIDEIVSEVRFHDSQNRTVMAIEGFSNGSRGRAVPFQYGLGWGLRIELMRERIPYHVIPPSNLKKFATGKGNAPKDIVRLEVYKRWGFENPSDNVIDAYVLAQMARALEGQFDLTKFQEDALKKIGEGKAHAG